MVMILVPPAFIGQDKMSNISEDEDEENPETCPIEISRGNKEDFISMIDETGQMAGWMRKFRDYDCYQKMQGAHFQMHHYVAKTKSTYYSC